MLRAENVNARVERVFPVVLIGQTEQVRAFHEFVRNGRDQADIQEKAIPEARFKFERAANNLLASFHPPAERQRDGLKEIERAEPGIGLDGIGKVRRGFAVASLLDGRQSQRVMGFVGERIEGLKRSARVA